MSRQDTVAPKRVVAVIVTYRPDVQDLKGLIASLLPQVDSIVVADNGSDASVAELLRVATAGRGCYLDMGGNLGVATALNRGAWMAFERGATHVLLSDQDSLPSPDLVAHLVAASVLLERHGQRVAAIGPRYVDPRSGYVSPFVVTRGLRLQTVNVATSGQPVEVDFVITSGSLISHETWLSVGPMSDVLFIDYVDIEWGLRARKMGYASYGLDSATLTHSLGDRRMAFLGKSVPIHSPMRHYYQIRNPLWLYRLPWIPLNWKVVDAFRLLLRFGFNVLFVEPRLENLRSMSRGLWHGVTRRSRAPSRRQ